MREIKFRVWDVTHKEMFKVKSVDFEESKIYYNGYKNTDGYYNRDFSRLMQYTGLKDKNGKEIYEGDTVEKPYGTINGNEETLVMKVFQDQTGAWRVRYPIGRLDNLYSIRNDIEVIGNIYEDPVIKERIN